MKKIIGLLFLGILVGAFGARAVSAVAPDDAETASSFYGPGCRWAQTAASEAYAGYGPGYCIEYGYYGTGEPVKLKVEIAAEALAIAKDKVDGDVSEEDIYQMGRWWIVFYEDGNGVYKQARIDAYTGEVFSGYTAPVRFRGGGGYGRGAGYCGGYGY